MRILKQIVAVSAIASGVFLATKGMMMTYEAAGKIVKNGRTYKPLSKEEEQEVLSTKIHEINHVYDIIKPLFQHYNITDDELLSLKTISPWQFETMSDQFEKIEFKTSYPDEETKIAYCRMFYVPSEQENVTDVILRLHIEDWNGYLDLLVCRCVAKNIENDLYLEVVEASPYLMDGPVVEDIIVYERFLMKPTSTIIVQNKASKSKFNCGKFGSEW